MSTIKVDTITDEAGTGAPDFPQGMTGDGSSLTGLATAAQGAKADSALQPDLVGVTSVDDTTVATLAAAGVGGGLDLISTTNITSDSASVQVTLPTGYNHLKIVYENVYMSSGYGGDYFRYSNSSGASRQSNYQTNITYDSNSSSTTYAASTGTIGYTSETNPTTMLVDLYNARDISKTTHGEMFFKGYDGRSRLVIFNTAIREDNRDLILGGQGRVYAGNKGMTVKIYGENVAWL